MGREQSQSLTTDGSGGTPRVPPEDALIGCRNVTKTFGAVVAVDNVSIGIEAGEWVSIVGPNGAGKTSLLNVINGFYDPDGDGRIFHRGDDITGLKSHNRARRGIARTFQGVELFHGDLLENVMTIRAVKNRPNLLESLIYLGPARRIEEENMRKAEEIIDYLELWQYRNSNISALPLGIQRRIDLARALALEPDVILLDEAVSGLTYDEKYDMIRFLTDLYEEEGMTLIMIEHDLEVVTEVSDRMIVLDQGAVIARGPPEDVTADPEVARVYTEA